MSNELFFTGAGDSLTIYAIIRRKSDAKVWSVANSAFETWANGSIADYDTALTTQGGDLYLGDFPSALTAGTRVLIQYYSQAGGTPAITDSIKLTVEGTWNGAEVASSSSVTIDSRALTTLASVKRLMNISVTTYDTILTELINQVSDRIERECGRRFAAANYNEWIDTQGEPVVAVRNWPVIRVDRVRYSIKDGLTLLYSGSDIEAAVSVYYDEEGQNGTLRLMSTSAAGTDTNTTFAFATYPTLSTLVTAADATSGWAVSRVGVPDALSTSLMPESGVDALNSTAYLRYAAQLDRRLRVSHRAGLVHTSVTCDSMVMVGYRAGYETIPDDINGVCNQLVQAAYFAGLHDGNLSSETIPDYSYSLVDSVKLADYQRQLLNSYRAVAVGGAA